MVGVVLATFSKEENSNIESLCMSPITSSENNTQIGASYVQQCGEQQLCSYVDSLCINIAPSTSVTACRGSASGKMYTCDGARDRTRVHGIPIKVVWPAPLRILCSTKTACGLRTLDHLLVQI